jgi:hypothetical protein
MHKRRRTSGDTEKPQAAEDTETPPIISGDTEKPQATEDTETPLGTRNHT